MAWYWCGQVLKWSTVLLMKVCFCVDRKMLKPLQWDSYQLGLFGRFSVRKLTTALWEIIALAVDALKIKYCAGEEGFFMLTTRFRLMVLTCISLAEKPRLASRVNSIITVRHAFMSSIPAPPQIERGPTDIIPILCLQPNAFLFFGIISNGLSHCSWLC